MNNMQYNMVDMINLILIKLGIMKEDKITNGNNINNIADIIDKFDKNK